MLSYTDNNFLLTDCPGISAHSPISIQVRKETLGSCPPCKRLPSMPKFKRSQNIFRGMRDVVMFSSGSV